MERVVFTNGCFDILHPGHIDLLTRAKALGTRLVVGINSDASVRQMKGSLRPLVDQEARKAVLLGLKPVDEVIVFDELTPDRLIRELKPDVLVKGGDWPVEQIVGADLVQANGGEVHSLPLLDGYSTSGIIERMAAPPDRSDTHAVNDLVTASLHEHRQVFDAVSDDLVASVRSAGEVIIETFASGGKVLLCGNGGSAADAQHIAAEFVGRYETERVALPAIALTTDTSALTALANDYDFERIFARQVDALANEGDCLIALSTSGNSPNVLAAVMSARAKNCRVIGLTGNGGRRLAGLSDVCVSAPSARTARVQEVHITVAHILCEMVDQAVTNGRIVG